MPAAKADNEARLRSINPGLMMINTPKKPKNTASQRCMPTFSFKKNIDNIVTIIGDTNASVSASASDIIDIA